MKDETNFFDDPVAEKDVPDDDTTEIEELFSQITPGTDLRGSKGEMLTADDIVDKEAMGSNNSGNNKLPSNNNSGLVSNSGHLEEGSRFAKDETIQQLERSEEIEAQIVREKGRFIEGIDNAKVGVTIDGRSSTDVPHAMPMDFATPAQAYMSDGVNTFDDRTEVYDPGMGAQTFEDVNNTDENQDPSDPRNPDFMGCVNSTCQYRDGCLRYRMKDRVNQAFPFFPEECRVDGTYIALDDTDFTAYSSMESLENGNTPSTLGAP